MAPVLVNVGSRHETKTCLLSDIWKSVLKTREKGGIFLGQCSKHVPRDHGYSILQRTVSFSLFAQSKGGKQARVWASEGQVNGETGRKETVNIFDSFPRAQGFSQRHHQFCSIPKKNSCSYKCSEANIFGILT